jgi:hypothetical protein
MNILSKQITDRISVKNVKHGFGHDLQGFYCDIYLDKKKVGYFNDDGWGGEPDVTLTAAAKATINQIFIDSGFKKDIETEWKIDNLDFETLVNELTAKLDLMSKIQRDQKKGILYGTLREYNKAYWVGKTLADIAKAPIGLQHIQKRVNEIKTKLKPNEMILNTNLESLGVIV